MSRLELREEDGKLLEARLIKEGQDDRIGSLSTGHVRGGFVWNFDVSATYVFLRTIANPKAIEELRKPEHRDAYARMRCITHDDFSVYFRSELCGVYLVAVRERAGRNCRLYRSYPLIEGARHCDGAQWPVIHVVEAGAENRLRRIVSDLNGEAAYRIVSKLESPQDYDMFEVNLLREKRIRPLVFQKRTWTVKGRDLRNALDFLIPYEYREPNSDTCLTDDD